MQGNETAKEGVRSSYSNSIVYDRNVSSTYYTYVMKSLHDLCYYLET